MSKEEVHKMISEAAEADISELDEQTPEMRKQMRLQSLLLDMDVPVQRRADLGWLLRNLGIRNSKHSNFAEVEQLLKELNKK